MIILASDYVGFKVVEYILNLNEKIDYLVLDRNDKGEFNNKIISLFKSKFNDKPILYNDELTEENLVRIEKSKPNLGILAWWPYILKGKILSITKIGWLNFHPGFLPYSRGKYPNFWCVVDQTKCGVSLQFIDEGIDTGDIVARKEIITNWEDTGKTIYEKSREEIIELFKISFKDIKENRLKREKQKQNEGTYHKPTEIDEISKIDLDKKYTARKLLNILRARMFPPYPVAFFYDNGKKYSIKIKIQEIKENE